MSSEEEFVHGYTRCSKCFASLSSDVVICTECVFPSVTEKFCGHCQQFYDPSTFHSLHRDHEKSFGIEEVDLDGDGPENDYDRENPLKVVETPKIREISRKKKKLEEEEESEDSDDSEHESEEEEEEEEGESDAGEEEGESSSSEEEDEEEESAKQKVKLLKTRKEINDKARKHRFKKGLITPKKMTGKIRPKKTRLSEHKKLGPQVQVYKFRKSSSEGSSDDDDDNDDDGGDEDDDEEEEEEEEGEEEEVEIEEEKPKVVRRKVKKEESDEEVGVILKGNDQEYPDLLLPNPKKKKKRKKKKKKLVKKKKPIQKKYPVVVRKERKPVVKKNPLDVNIIGEVLAATSQIRINYQRDINVNFSQKSMETHIKTLKHSLMNIIRLSNVEKVKSEVNSPGSFHVYDPSGHYQLGKQRPSSMMMKLIHYSKRWYSHYSKFKKDFQNKYKETFSFTKNVKFEGHKKSDDTEIFELLKNEFSGSDDLMYMLPYQKMKFDLMNTIGVMYATLTIFEKTGQEFIHFGKADRGLEHRIFSSRSSLVKSANKVEKPIEYEDITELPEEVFFRLSDIVHRLAGNTENKTYVFIIGDFRMPKYSSMKYWAKKLRKVSLEFGNCIVVNERTNYPTSYSFSIRKPKGKGGN